MAYVTVKESDLGWSFVRPDGARFVATGFNHATVKFLQASYNREKWQEVVDDPNRFVEMLVRDTRDLNMTALGYGPDPLAPGIPYVASLRVPAPMTWADVAEYFDPFAPEFENTCRELAEQVCGPRQLDRDLIGYYLADCVEWPDPGRASKRLSESWLDFCKRLEPEAPGKKVFVDLLRRRYRSILHLNAVYGSTFGSFDAILHDRRQFMGTPRMPERAKADDVALLALLAERWFEVATAAVRRVDPNHLILGQVLDGNRHVPSAVIQAYARTCEVISIQHYGAFKDSAAFFESLHRVSGLPILLADGCYSVPTADMPRTCGPRVKSQAERADRFELYAREALAIPYIIGWFWCGYIDGHLEIEPRRQHSGLMDANGERYEPLWTRIRETYGELLSRGRGQE